MVDRVVTGARYGVRDWLVQRVSAMYMAIYTLFFVGLLLNQSADYAHWRGLFSGLPMRLATALFALCLYWHAWIGVRDICMDYLKSLWLRLLVEALSILALVVYTAWTLHILWSLS